MKRNVLLALFAFILLVKATAQSSGIYESYAILSLNGGANTYYDLQASTTNPDFNGTNLGMFRAGTSQLLLNGAQNKTYKNGGCDITNGVLYYRVYLTSGAGGSFSSLNMSFLCEYPTAGCGSNTGDQVWEVANGNVNLINGLTPGNYTVEVYTSANYQGCGTGTHYSNNGGANYKASFIVYSDFISTWKTDNLRSGSTNSTSISIPTAGTGYNYDVDWDNDGVYDQLGITGGIVHDFGTAGTYTIRIRGAFPRIFFNSCMNGDCLKLINISQWGSIAWTSMGSAFAGCSNLTITATDIPDLSSVTDMGYCFYNCGSLNGPANIGSWNTSSVTNMTYMFALTPFNQPIGNWNTSSVTNMESMFFYARNFNQPIGNWNVANVTTMRSMFHVADVFNQPLGNWNVANVTDMRNMFYHWFSNHINQNLGTWTLNANVNMQGMFDNSGMDCSHYSATLMGWSNNPATPNGRSLGASGRQYSTVAEAARTNLTTTKGWTITGDAPSGNNCDPGAFITTWKTDNAGTSNSTSITIPTTGSGYNYDVDWNNDGVYDELGLTGNVTHDFVTSGTFTIRIRGGFPRIYFNNTGDKLKLLNISQWGSIAWSSMENAFYGCQNLNITTTDIPNLTGVTNMRAMFFICTSLNGPANIGSWNTSTVTNMSRLFAAAASFNQSIDNWNTSLVTDMSQMFSNAGSFNQNIGNWNTGAVTNMSNMFYQATVFNQPIVDWNTGAVTNMSNMFALTGNFNQNIGNWNTGAVTNMSNMFYQATVFNQPIGNWSTTVVSSMDYMFAGATAFNQQLANWNTSAVTNMAGMFTDAISFNQPIGSWNVNMVSDMRNMFYNAASFNQNLGTWSLRNAGVNMTNMLSNSGFNCSNYSATLVGWSKNPSTPSGITLGATGRQYNYTGLAARNYLVNTKGWTISDAGNAASSVLGATAGGAQVCQNTDVSVGKLYTDGCNSLLMVTPNDASPVTGTINACVKIDNTVQFYNGEAYLQRHFDITPANNPATSTARITLYALQSEFDAFNAVNATYYPDLPTGPADAAGIAALRITQYGGTGTAPGNYTGPAKFINPDDADIVWNGYHWEISFNVTGFSGFYIHAPRLDFALPVTFLNFSGYKDGSRNQLSWTTATEINNRGFEVQRSTDGVNYIAIGFVSSLAPGGNSNDKLSYRFTDNTPAGVKQYYRLRQEDFDGRNKLSTIVLINGSKPTGVMINGLFPNPANDILNVLVAVPGRTPLTVLVTDMAGRTLSQKVVSAETGSNTIQLNVGSLSSGTYLIRLVCEDGCQPAPAKFVKQ
jgi:surface protein